MSNDYILNLQEELELLSIECLRCICKSERQMPAVVNSVLGAKVMFHVEVTVQGAAQVASSPRIANANAQLIPLNFY